MVTKGRHRHLLALLFTLLLLLLLAAIIAIIVLATELREKRCSDKTESTSCIDVAVVGAGISGSYSAWRLRNMFTNISLFEYSDRIGGRLYSRHFPDGVKVELGGMRYLPSIHHDFSRLVEELNLTSVPFGGHHGPEHSIYYLRGTRKWLNETVTTSDFPGYAFRLEELGKDTTDLRWMFLEGAVDVANQNTSDAMEYITRSGELFRNIGYQNMLGKQASLEAKAFLKSTYGYDGHFINGNAASLGLAPPRAPEVANTTSHPTPEAGVTGTTETPSTLPRLAFQASVKEGMQTVVERLVERFLSERNTNSFHKNHMLKSIRNKNEGKNLLLKFKKTITQGYQTFETEEEVDICARKVLLAVPERSLELIDWKPLHQDQTTKANMHSYRGIPALKFFLVFDNPWWRRYSIRNIVTDLPIRKALEYSVSNDSKSVLLASYSDAETVGYWRGLLLGDTSDVSLPNSFNVTKKLIDHALMYIAEAMGIERSEIPSPIGATVQFWDTDPIGHAWYIFMPGFHWNDVRDYMSKPDPSHDVHVTSTYGLNYEPGFADGAIQIAKYTLKKHFGLTD